MKNLVVVESPTKARTLARFLGPDFQIEATLGHLRDLPKSKLGVDVEHDFEPFYTTIPKQRKRVSELKKIAAGAEKIILATDPDREGEAIAYHVREILPSVLGEVNEDQWQRIVFHEITEPAIREALAHPRQIDMNLVLAQQARRVLDRLVGYKLSPLLWRKVRKGLSAGRVQSVAVRLIVEREREIKNFVPEEYWRIEVKLVKKEKDVAVTFTLSEKNGQKFETRKTFDLFAGPYTVTKTTIENETQAREITKDLEGQIYKVVSVDKREVRRTPPPPFTTSTLQQEAGRRLGFPAKQTMSLAQKLYEEGFITYHRTDSLALSPIFLKVAREFLKKEYGPKYASLIPRIYKTKSKLAQEAHEAIRPTALGNQELGIRNQLGEKAAKLYEIIWQRALASQAAEAILETTGVGVLTDNGYKFYTSGSVVKFYGFLKIYPQALEEKVLPIYHPGEILDWREINPYQKFTEPPPRYTEMSLVKTQELAGIGRPSTYAPIISTIQERRYVEKQEGKFLPTVLGEAVNDFLVANFLNIVEIPFTAEMEDELDEIAQGEKEWVPVLRGFYSPFEKKLAQVETEAKRVKVEAPQVPGEKCDKCGAPLVLRLGKFGKFLACSRFPDCDFTKAYWEKTDLTCPRCGGEILLKKTKKGRKFFGCSNWPKCKFAAWRREEIEKAEKN